MTYSPKQRQCAACGSTGDLITPFRSRSDVYLACSHCLRIWIEEEGPVQFRSPAQPGVFQRDTPRVTQ